MLLCDVNSFNIPHEIFIDKEYYRKKFYQFSDELGLQTDEIQKDEQMFYDNVICIFDNQKLV